MAEGRLVAVLGYSPRGDEGRALDPVCLRRLRHAEGLAAGARGVLLSGWSRHPHGTAEADLMQAAWRGPEVPLLRDPTARHTRGNAAGIALHARELGVEEVLVVTSRWHLPRAQALVRAALRGSGLRVRGSAPRERPPVGPALRELACLAALPLQLPRRRANVDEIVHEREVDRAGGRQRNAVHVRGRGDRQVE
jgi:hypothetical protein